MRSTGVHVISKRFRRGVAYIKQLNGGGYIRNCNMFTRDEHSMTTIIEYIFSYCDTEGISRGFDDNFTRKNFYPKVTFNFSESKV